MSTLKSSMNRSSGRRPSNDISSEDSSDPGYEAPKADSRSSSTRVLTLAVAAASVLLLAALVWFAIAEGGSAPATPVSAAQDEPARP